MAAEMMGLRRNRGSLLWRILFSTSLAVTAVFALTGWMVQRYAANVSQHSIEEEVRTSLQAYESLWGARVHNLTSISRIISSMADVRAAFMTKDRATIRDTAEQLWMQISEQDASFLVLDPTGVVITSLGGNAGFSVEPSLVNLALKRFPSQVSGYARRSSHLYYLVLTPVYVQTAQEPALLNILLVAFDIDRKLAEELKASTHGSDFAFVSSGVVCGSTLPGITAAELNAAKFVPGGIRTLKVKGSDYVLLGADLLNPFGGHEGELFIIRSFAGQKAVLADLKRNVGVFWGVAIFVALVLTYLLSTRILDPVKRLDRAAEEVIRRNYEYRVPVETNDELGRLARTFNTMCESIRSAREELIRQEQIATIARLASSIVHDLRNPLAAIYGGAEMLVDAELSPEQRRRLAGNIYNASRRIQELLQELVDVCRAKTRPVEPCRIAEIAACAVENVSQRAEMQSVRIAVDIPEHLHVVADRDRLERVLLNLIDNALDAMPEGGAVGISGCERDSAAIITVEDSGPGIPEEAWPRLFQPFASFRKRNGLGLGLALSRQTLLDHGGDLWAENKPGGGARFLARLPLAAPPDVAASSKRVPISAQS